MGFLACCRPAWLSLTGKIRVVVVAAIALDGNDVLFPVAFGMVESGYSNSSMWVLVAFKEANGTPDGPVLCQIRWK